MGLTIALTIVCRALHPPAGAVAMTAAMSPEIISELGFRFVITPVAAGTVMLVLLAAIYARLTGRTYPMRRLDDPNANATGDPAPSTRLGLSQDQLVSILERYRQSHNLAAQDLARLVGAAELQAAALRVGPVTAEGIMSRDLVTVGPQTPQAEVVRLFRQHRFTSIPVVGTRGRYLGVILQIHLIRAAGHLNGSSSQLMQQGGPQATPATPLAELLSIMADGEIDAVPVLEEENLHGMNGLKNVLSALLSLIASVVFVFANLIAWEHAVALSLSAAVGGYAGTRLSRRITRVDLLRLFITAVGAAMTAAFFLR